MFRQVKLQTQTIGLGAFLLIGLITIQGFALYYAKTQTEHKEDVSLLLEELEAAIGYRGLIHHFKNAVLRPDRPSYIDLAYERGERAQMIVSLLEQETVDLNLITADNDLEKTHATIAGYIENLSLVEEGHAAGMEILEIDQLVKIDDVPATSGQSRLTYGVAKPLRMLRK